MYIGQAGALRLDTTAGLKYEDKASRMYNNWVAEQMEREGKDARTILQATGWQRLKDGLWRYELPDGKFTPVPGDSAVTKSRFTVGQLYDDKQLYEAYPALKDMPLLFKNLGPNIGGYVGVSQATGQKVMVINTSRLDLKTRVLNDAGKRTLVHEIQHLVQQVEGFAQGGDEKSAKAAFRREYGRRAADVMAWSDAYLPSRGTAAVWRGAVTSLGEARIRRAYWSSQMAVADEAERAKLEGKVQGLDREIAKERGRLDEMYTNLDERTVQEARALEDEAALVLGLDYVDDYFKYWYLGGENESRNTAKRIGMTEAERRTSTFDDTADIAGRNTITEGAAQPSAPLQEPTPAPVPKPKQAQGPAGFGLGQQTFGWEGGEQGRLFSKNRPYRDYSVQKTPRRKRSDQLSRQLST